MSNHYKEREPSQTVSIIKKFFDNRNFKTEIKDLKETNCGTWGCQIVLYFQDTVVGRSNGKGLTSNFALASGYAELYERFCNKLQISNPELPLVYKKFINLNYELNGYYFHPEEKICKYKELFNLENFKDWYSLQFSNSDYLQEYINFLLDNKYVQIPYKNLINENDIKYVNPLFLNHCNGSNGMAAGNTFEEAINQGISELYERYCLAQLVLNGQKLTYYQLSDEAIPTILQPIKQKIIAEGNTLSLYDFSYNFNLPVIGGVLYNHLNKTSVVVLGSFPIFDIAIERVLTEMYQNRFSYNNWIGHVLLPERNSTLNERLNQLISSITQNNIIESIFLNDTKIINHYNENYFLNNQKASNLEIYQWNIDLCKHKNFNVYYLNNSLCEEMYSIRLFSPELSITWIKNNEANSSSYTEKEKYICLKQAIKFQNELENYMDMKDNNPYNFITYYCECFKKISQNSRLLNCLLTFLGSKNSDPLIPFGSLGFLPSIGRENFIKIILDIYDNKNIIKHLRLIENSLNPFKKEMLNFLIIQQYVQSRKYNKEEIKKILKALGESINDEFLNNINNSLYILYNLCFKHLQSFDYKEYLRGYMK